MAGQKMELGPTGNTVAENVKRIRVLRALNYADLSRSVTERGRSISPLAIRRIEEGARRVDVDDLTALAASLRCSPIVLLSPDVELIDEEVEATGVPTLSARDLWAWFRADQSIEGGGALGAWVHFQESTPAWRRQQVYEGVEGILELNQAEREAKAGNPAKLNQLIEDSRKLNGDD